MAATKPLVTADFEGMSYSKQYDLLFEHPPLNSRLRLPKPPLELQAQEPGASRIPGSFVWAVQVRPWPGESPAGPACGAGRAHDPSKVRRAAASPAQNCSGAVASSLATNPACLPVLALPWCQQNGSQAGSAAPPCPPTQRPGLRRLTAPSLLTCRPSFLRGLSHPCLSLPKLFPYPPPPPPARVHKLNRYHSPTHLLSARRSSYPPTCPPTYPPPTHNPPHHTPTHHPDVQELNNWVTRPPTPPTTEPPGACRS